MRSHSYAMAYFSLPFSSWNHHHLYQPVTEWPFADAITQQQWSAVSGPVVSVCPALTTDNSHCFRWWTNVSHCLFLQETLTSLCLRGTEDWQITGSCIVLTCLEYTSLDYMYVYLSWIHISWLLNKQYMSQLPVCMYTVHCIHSCNEPEMPTHCSCHLNS